MTILQWGNGNVNIANYPPGVLEVVQNPQPNTTPGLQTDTIFLVGTAQGGPVNQPIDIEDFADYQATFGTILNEPNDMGSFIYNAQQIGSNDFVCVRVTDGTDLKASINVVDVTSVTPVTGAILTALYSGTLGNTITVSISNGSNYTTAVKVFKVTITLPNGYTEIFDNIGGTGATLWANIVSAINNGQTQEDGPSTLVTAAIGTATALPKVQSYTLAGGTTGNSGVDAQDLVGVDDAPPTGMYTTRGKGIGNMALVGCVDATTFGAQGLFGQQEGRFMVLSGPIGQTPASAITFYQGAAAPNPMLKPLVGDWQYWFDPINNIWRWSTQQAMACSLYSTLDPNQSGLNKQITLDTDVITQRSQANRPYTSFEILQLSNAGIDVVAYNVNLGSYFSLQTGKNASFPINQNSTVLGWDTYSRLTPFIAYTQIAINMQFVGQLNTPDVDKTAFAVNADFLQSLVKQGWIQSYTVVVTANGNVLTVSTPIVMFDVISNVVVYLQNGVPSFTVTTVPNTQANRKLFKLAA